MHVLGGNSLSFFFFILFCFILFFHCSVGGHIVILVGLYFFCGLVRMRCFLIVICHAGVFVLGGRAVRGSSQTLFATG